MRCVTYFFNIVCCLTLNVNLENDVKDKQGNYEGVYTIQGFSDGMDYWVDAEGENAIWNQAIPGSTRWRFGRLDQLGLYGHVLRSDVKIIENECPNNEGYVWNWEYKDSGTWTATNDVYIKCVDEGNC